MAELVSESCVSTSGRSRHRRNLFFSTLMDGNKEERLHTTRGSNSPIVSLLKAISISHTHTHTLSLSLSLMMMMNRVWSRTF
jgi:hypothetical protein